MTGGDPEAKDTVRRASIPFNRPFCSGKEFEFMKAAIGNWQLSGDGEFTRRCHAFLEKELGVRKAFLTTSCTHALEMAALLLEIKPGDEVIVPSFTFVSTANAFVLRGARPVFVDVRADTLNLDERKLVERISERTKAIVVVHYAGVACEMDAITAIAAEHGVPVVEDNAHGLFGRYNDRYLGTFGLFATQSFHETKNFTCGEGGALLINDKGYVERAEILREKGTDRSRFFRGQVDKYTWVDIGSSYLPSDILAAFLYAQFLARDMIQERRRRIWCGYQDGLREWAMAHDIRGPCVPAGAVQPYHMFYLVLPSLEIRQALIRHLDSQGINSVFHYQPLHLSNMGRRFGGQAGDCPVSESLSERLLRLPFYNDLTVEDQTRVVDEIKGFSWPARV